MIARAGIEPASCHQVPRIGAERRFRNLDSGREGRGPRSTTELTGLGVDELSWVIRHRRSRAVSPSHGF